VNKSERMLTALQNHDLAQAEKYFEDALSQDTDQELLELADYLESIGFFIRFPTKKKQNIFFFLL